jgi:4-carboxymuconolactone decarboxylase
MTSFPILNRDILEDDDQRDFWDEITQGPRGFYSGGKESKRLPDLYNAWMQFPEFGRSIFRVADGLRQGGHLPGKLRELLVLTTSIKLGARVEYEFHIPFARDQGLSDEAITAIGEGRVPPFADDAERILYEANVQLLETATLTEKTRREVIDLMGDRGLMHLIAAVMVYVVTAYTTNIGGVKLAEDFSADQGELNDFFAGKVAAD